MHDFGQDVAMAFGAGGTPVVAWASLTDSSNSVYTISATSFVTETGWSSPVEVARARLAPGPTASLFTMSGAMAEGVVAHAFERRDDTGFSAGVDVMFSTDLGRSWARSAAADGEAYHPAVTVGGGAMHVAYASAEGYSVSSAVLPPRSRAEPPAPIDGTQLAWKVQQLPALEGFTPADKQPSVALDNEGRPAVASISAGADNTQVATFVHVGDRNAAKAIELAGNPGGVSSVSLAFAGTRAVVSLAIEPRAQAGVLASVASSDDGGETFNAAQPVLDGLNERAPFGIGLVAVTPPGGQTVSTATTTAPKPAQFVLNFEPDMFKDTSSRCGLPRLVYSSDLSSWTECGAGTDVVSPATAVIPANLTPSAVAGPDGRLYVPVTNRNPSAPLPVGIVLWRA